MEWLEINIKEKYFFYYRQIIPKLSSIFLYGFLYRKMHENKKLTKLLITQTILILKKSHKLRYLHESISFFMTHMYRSKYNRA